MHQLYYHPRAFKQLKKLTKSDQKKVARVIYALKKDPFSKNLDVRRFYRTRKSYRIRVGDLRAIYEVDQDKKEVLIVYIGYRGQIY